MTPPALRRLTPASKLKAWWTCDCGKTFERVIRNVMQMEMKSCSTCSNAAKATKLRAHAVRTKGSLRDRMPELAKEWHPDNDRSSSEVSPYSSEVAKWTCGICEHEWEDTPRRRALHPRCPACPPDWSIGQTPFLPHIDKGQDDYNDIVNLGVHSKRSIAWICQVCSISFRRAVRHVDDHSDIRCRGCRGLDTGTLADNREDLVAEWHPDNAFGPEDVTQFSWKYVKWQCSDCGHTWETSVANRTNRKSGCPNCWKRSGPTSRTEIELRDNINAVLDGGISDNTYIVINTEDARRHVVADMTTDDMIVVEYDSEYWHRDRIDRDNERLGLMNVAGYEVISIREIGLPLLTDSDLVYDPKLETLSGLAQRVVDRITAIRSLRVE